MYCPNVVVSWLLLQCTLRSETSGL